jgi:hypothetical protein
MIWKIQLGVIGALVTALGLLWWRLDWVVQENAIQKQNYETQVQARLALASTLGEERKERAVNERLLVESQTEVERLNELEAEIVTVIQTIEVQADATPEIRCIDRIIHPDMDAIIDGLFNPPTN